MCVVCAIAIGSRQTIQFPIEKEERREERKGGEKRKRASPSKENRRRCDDTALHAPLAPLHPTYPRHSESALSPSLFPRRAVGGRAVGLKRFNQPTTTPRHALERAPAANRQNFDLHRPLLRRTLATLPIHPPPTTASQRKRKREKETGKRRKSQRPNQPQTKQTQKNMPTATETRAREPIIDPASEHGEEIDAAVDRDRIRVVCCS
jgi:hypothetical protein